MNQTWRIVLTVIWMLLALVSVFPAVMTAFLFDSPGSENSKITQALAFALLALPPSWLAGIALGWIFRKHRIGGWLFFVPFIDVAAIVALFWALEAFCNGRFACN